MKKSLSHTLCLAILYLLAGTLNPVQAQKDTLHIYYQGLQTNILDSNDVKITKWVKSLNGRKVELEIYGYYESSEYKKYMAERIDNLFLVVNRKARDLITVKFMGPVKGKKSQRSTADIVYSNVAAPAAPVAAPTTNKEVPAAKDVAATEVKSENKAKEPKPAKEPKAAKEPKKKTEKADKAVTSEVKETSKEEPKEEPKQEETSSAPAPEPKPVMIGKTQYIVDTIYVNGKPQVRKTKVKKQK